MSRAFLGQSVAMVHRVKCCPEEVDGDLPVVHLFEQGRRLGCLLVVPDDVDLGYQARVAGRLGVSLQIFLQNREVPVPGMRDCQQSETTSLDEYLSKGS